MTRKLILALTLIATAALAANVSVRDNLRTSNVTVVDTEYKLGIPGWLQFTGTGSEGTTSPCGAIVGAVTASGEHHCSSLTISGAGQIDVDPAVGWLVMRSTGACSIASTATCLGAANTAIANCAISGTGADNGPDRNEGFLGGSGAGGGGAETANSGSSGNDVANNILGLETVAGAGGGVGADGVVGAQPATRIRQYFLAEPFSPDVPTNTLNWVGGSKGGVGGMGTDAGGVGGKGGAVVILVCGSFTTTTGQIVIEGQRGGNGTNNISDSGGGGGGGAGAAFISGDVAYPAANVDCVGGNGGTEGGAPAGNGGAGGNGTCWICQTGTGACVEDLT